MQLCASSVPPAVGPSATKPRRPVSSACTSLPYSQATPLRCHMLRPGLCTALPSIAESGAVLCGQGPIRARLTSAHTASSSYSRPLLTKHRQHPSTSPNPIASANPLVPSASAGEAYNVADKPAAPPTGRAVVVGGGPSGLAAAIGLAKRAGFAVDVFDSRPDPSRNKGAAGSSLLVALGERG